MTSFLKQRLIVCSGAVRQTRSSHFLSILRILYQWKSHKLEELLFFLHYTNVFIPYLQQEGVFVTAVVGLHYCLRCLDYAERFLVFHHFLPGKIFIQLLKKIFIQLLQKLSSRVAGLRLIILRYLDCDGRFLFFCNFAGRILI